MWNRKYPTRKSFSRAALAGLTFLLTAWAGSSMDPGPNTPATLKLSIIDETSKQPTPARVEVLDRDGKGYVADDALLIGGD